MTHRDETLQERLPWLPRLLWQWLIVGAVLTLMFSLHASAWPVGSWTYWSLLAPGTALLTLYRHAVVAAWRGFLVSAPRRHRPRRPGAQARRVGFGSAVRRRAPRAA